MTVSIMLGLVGLVFLVLLLRSYKAQGKTEAQKDAAQDLAKATQTASDVLAQPKTVEETEDDLAKGKF